MSPDAIEAKITAHADFWKRAEAHVRLRPIRSRQVSSHVRWAEAAPVLERALGAAVRFIQARGSDARGATEGRRSITAKLSLGMQSLAITRNGARLDIGLRTRGSTRATRRAIPW